MPPAGTGNRAADEQQVALGVALDDLQVERRRAHVSELAGHAHALEHARRRGAGTDRARRPVTLVIAVRRALAGEVVALHHAGEAVALADAGHVDPLAGCEHVGLHDLAELEAGEVDDAQLGEVLRGVGVRRLQVAELGLRQALRLGLAEGELHRGVAVALRGLDLDHATGPGLDDGDRDDPVPLVEDLGHAELSAQDPFVRHCRLRCDALVGRAAVPRPRERSARSSRAERDLGCAARFRRKRGLRGPRLMSRRTRGRGGQRGGSRCTARRAR